MPSLQTKNISKKWPLGEKEERQPIVAMSYLHAMKMNKGFDLFLECNLCNDS